MRSITSTRSLAVAVVFWAFGIASALRADARLEPLAERNWTVDGAERTALVHMPSADAKSLAPLVFVFHGHGGNSGQAARSFRVHELWPDAVVVYPQGLKTPGRLTDPEGKRSGWQKERGDQGDRDLKFFDAMIRSFLDENRVDPARAYVTGHSNGGAFTYLLWAERGGQIAAVAPSGALDAKSVRVLKPKPMFHVAGKSDPLVKFEWQRKMIDAVLAVNQCERPGETDGEFTTTYASKAGAPVVTYFHDAGHRFPPAAAAAIVKFFQSQPGKPQTRPS